MAQNQQYPMPNDDGLDVLNNFLFGENGFISQGTSFNILDYQDFYVDADEEYYKQFALNRIYEKCGTIYQNCEKNGERHQFILQQDKFIQYFINEFLKRWRKHSVFDKIANELINKSRSPPTTGYPLGMPTINPAINNKIMII